jgi:hypothetical protein
MIRFLVAFLFATLPLDCKQQQARPELSTVQSGVDQAAVPEMDHEFKAGSGIAVPEQLSRTQIENLATLGRVWGFLKYHHPKVTAGQTQWDYELFRIMPQILAATDSATAIAALVKWVASFGPVAPCKPCVGPDMDDISVRSDVAWIRDKQLLGDVLSESLQTIYANRANDQQFYVSGAPVGNPLFDEELAYEQLSFPDPGFQLLALYRYWNVIAYWYPYRDMIGEDWNAVLTEFVPRMALAKDSESYQRQLMELAARVRDGHASISSSLYPPIGNCRLPIDIQFVEHLPVIGRISTTAEADHTELEIGDVITSLDNVPVNKLIQGWAPYYGASNEPFRLFLIGQFMTKGACDESSVGVRRGNKEVTLKVTRVASDNWKAAPHDLPGPTFRLLSKDVAYLKLSSIKANDARKYVEQAGGTKGLIIDIRNYPSEFVVFALGSHLVKVDTPFARVTKCDFSNPGTFHWASLISLVPEEPHYSGKVVILVDERTLSQAEYTAMAFRAAQGAIVVGNSTAGADGDVSFIPLPGGLRGTFSGIGVFYPNKAPTQGVGIRPDVYIEPTIAGIGAGRDEMLEEALRQILGTPVPSSVLENMAKP